MQPTPVSTVRCDDARAALARILARVVGGTRAVAWLNPRASVAEAESAFATASRAFGRDPLVVDPDEWTLLDAAHVRSRLDRWCVDDLARVLLAIDLATREADGVAILRALYDHGDNRERHAVLRALPFLPQPERFVDLGVSACRTHVQTVFEAIACDNGYPAACFPELAYNQMVLKCLFTGAPLARVVGLAERTTPELVRMVDAYASERRAAGRAVPTDATLISEGASR